MFMCHWYSIGLKGQEASDGGLQLLQGVSLSFLQQVFRPQVPSRVIVGGASVKFYDMNGKSISCRHINMESRVRGLRDLCLICLSSQSKRGTKSAVVDNPLILEPN
jgi:hypothetical protein